MEIKTRRFGEIKIDRDEIIYFPQGILGFPQQREFILLPTQDNSPLFWLQAVNDPDIAFVVTEPWVFKEDYAFELKDKDKKELQITEKEDIRVLCLLVIPEEAEKMTINLKGPLVLNIKKRLGRQVVIQEDYSHRQPVATSVTASA